MGLADRQGWLVGPNLCGVQERAFVLREMEGIWANCRAGKKGRQSPPGRIERTNLGMLFEFSGL